MTEETLATAKVKMREFVAKGMEADKALRVALWIVKDGLTEVEALAYANNLDWDA
jgi:hypothetical protein